MTKKRQILFSVIRGLLAILIALLVASRPRITENRI